MKKYKQFYTSSLFNIKNIIDFSKETTCINIFTMEDIEVFNKISKKQVVYNSELHFFNCLDIVNKVITSNIPIYSDNINIRKYLFKNKVKLRFIKKQYIQVYKNINISLFNRFKISSDEKVPLVIRFDVNDVNVIIERLKKKLPTIIIDNIDKINIWEIEKAVLSKRFL